MPNMCCPMQTPRPCANTSGVMWRHSNRVGGYVFNNVHNVGPRASGFVTGKDGEAGDIGVYRRCSRTPSSRKTSRSKRPIRFWSLILRRNWPLHQGDLWDSAKQASNQSVHVVYAGKALQSNQSCYWKLRVWDKQGRVSAWSEPAVWTMGLCAPTDWQGPMDQGAGT